MLLVRLFLLFILIAPLGDEGSGLDPHGGPRTTGVCIDPDGCADNTTATDPNG